MDILYKQRKADIDEQNKISNLAIKERLADSRIALNEAIKAGKNEEAKRIQAKIDNDEALLGIKRDVANSQINRNNAAATASKAAAVASESRAGYYDRGGNDPSQYVTTTVTHDGLTGAENTTVTTKTKKQDNK